MDKSVVVALISGAFSTFSALGAIFLKDYLESRRLQRAAAKGVEAPAASMPGSAPPIPQPAAAPRPTRGAAPPVARSSSRPWMRPVSIVAASFVIGMLSRAVRPYLSAGVHYDALLALAILIALALYLAISNRRRGSVIAYELENFAVWSGWVSGWTVVNGQVWGDIVSVAFISWIGCAVVGGLIVAVNNSASRERD